MVKFGRHLEFYQLQQQQAASQDEDEAPRDGALQQHKQLYVVPYNDVKARYMPTRQPQPSGDGVAFEVSNHSDDSLSSSEAECLDEARFFRSRFKTEWRSCLTRASGEFDAANRRFWATVFAGIHAASHGGGDDDDDGWDSDCSDGVSGSGVAEFAPQPRIDREEVRGALPDAALRMYLGVASAEDVQALYSGLKEIHGTALINCEALRKLVKKFDKDIGKMLAETAAAASGEKGAAASLSSPGGPGGGVEMIQEVVDAEGGRKNSPCSVMERGEGAPDAPPPLRPSTPVRRGGGGGRRRRNPALNLRLSSVLLPEVYSANFTVGLPTVEAALALIRQHLCDYDDDDDDDFDDGAQAARLQILTGDNDTNVGDGGGISCSLGKDVAGFFGLSKKRRDTDGILVEKRKTELRWLRSLVENLRLIERSEGEEGEGGMNVYGGISLLGCLVAHRGFHSIKDGVTKRPLENSLMSYEAAWTNGIHLCECDIALTKDDRLILAHDDNLVRLAMDPTDPMVQRKVTDLTYKEIISLPLKSGSRPPLLFDVLRSARAIGGEARMVVEIKPGNCEAGTALAKMFVRYPALMERCAVVMSFDAFAMQNLRRELEVLFPTCEAGTTSTTTNVRVAPSSRAMIEIDEDLLPPPPAGSFRTVQGHRRGISHSGSGIISNVPTVMSIGDVRNLTRSPAEAMTAAMAAAAMDGEDHFGMSLARKDSFKFSPFGQIASPKSFQPVAPGVGGFRPPSSPQPKSPRAGPIAGDLPPPLHPSPLKPRSEEAPPPRPPITSRISSAPAANEPPTPPILRATTPLHTVAIPKLLLITRNGPAQTEEQKDALKVDVKNPEDLKRIGAWLQGGSPSERLDGLYMQYQPHMVDTEEGQQAMTALTDQYTVGIWGANPKPDDFETFSQLVGTCGVSYVNSSLSKRFFRKIRRGSGGGGAGMAMAAAKIATEEDFMQMNNLTWPRMPQTSSAGHLGLPW